MGLDEDITIEDEPAIDAVTVGDYYTDNVQTIEVQCCNRFGRQILYNARPSCKHKVQAQWSGIKCIVCNGWYCAS